MKFVRQNKTIIIFPESMSHSEVKRYFNLCPETAGFAQAYPKEDGFDFSIYGQSTGLKIQSDPENDQKILKDHTDFSTEKPFAFAVSSEFNEVFFFPVSESENVMANISFRDDIKHGVLSITTEKETDPMSCRSLKAVANIIQSNKPLDSDDLLTIRLVLNR